MAYVCRRMVCIWCFVECLLPVELVNCCVKSGNCLTVIVNSLLNTAVFIQVVEMDVRIPGVSV